ncbi:right-handed parallel beta-helix repeat-containing protein [Paraliomyxa miuraensis]|uniref:hypothetical protein n=1 Tax=Paraliomyxa miuraensis TaxID=376150 RepID=UPI002255ADE0|nr:hypothetical protein [Paraliomyxa miuraensis]MCX4247877.1 hypothetical protein [Paraliomyxa miuraensis]
MRAILLTLSVGTIAGSCVGAACTYPVPNHCANQNGDFSCLGGNYCNICILENNGCVDAMPSQDCHFVGHAPDGTGGEGSTTSTSEESGVGSDITSLDGEDTIGVVSTSGDDAPVECEPCPADAPSCVDGQCVPCDEADTEACGGRNEPVCLGGSCVVCTEDDLGACSEGAEVCDPATHTCLTSCSTHDECGGVACNMFVKGCLPVESVVHVGPGQTFGSIADAVASFDAGARGTIIVHQGTYAEPITIDEGKVLGILANPGDLPVLSDPGGAPRLLVTDGTLIMDGLSISGNGGGEPAVQVRGLAAWLWADRSRIVDNAGGGILVEEQAKATVRNCFVGGVLPNVEALEVDDVGTVVEVSYSTLIGGGGGDDGDGTHALQCSPFPLNPLIQLKNSIVLDTGPADNGAECDSAGLDYSALEFAHAGNTKVDSYTDGLDWFTDTTTDFTLTGEGAAVFANIAVWNEGDPPTDILGTPRPGNGMPDFAGAHIFVP